MRNKAQFGQDVLAQALGTTIGAGAILLIGKVSGLLSGVDWSQVGAVLGFGTGVIGVLFFVGQWVDGKMQKSIDEEHQDQQKRIRDLLANLTPEEAEAVYKRADPGRWQTMSEEEKKAVETIFARGLMRQKD